MPIAMLMPCFKDNLSLNNIIPIRVDIIIVTPELRGKSRLASMVDIA